MTIRPTPGYPHERRRAERSPERNSDDLVGAVVRLMPDAAIVVDDGGRVVAANSLAENLFGYESGGLSGEEVDLLVPERLRAGHSGHRRTYTENPTQRPMGAGLELLARRRDGTEFPVDISLAPLGVPERPLTLAAIRDLTERRAEWAAVGRLAAIVSATDDAIVSVDLRGTVSSWNAGAQRLLGYRAEEMIGRPVLRLVPHDMRPETDELLERVRAGIRIPSRDTRRTRKDGKEVDVSESISLIREPSEEAIGFAWLMRDVTERKLAELELRRLLTETQRRERWLEAISDIRLSLLGEGDLGDSLALVATQVCELVDSNAAAVLLASEVPGHLELAAREGEAFSDVGTDPFPARGSMFEQVLTSGEVWSEPDLGARAGAETTLAPRGATNSLIGSIVVAPLTTSQGTRGVLAVSRSPGRPSFDREDTRMVESFAQQAGLTVEIAQAQGVREQLTLMADRERIARDLHDHVIQRLFATGMALQAAANSLTDSKVLDRINDSVEELDATIRDVRSTIFSLELRASERVEKSARAQILDIASKAAAGLGFQPRIQFGGPVDTRLPEDMVPDVLAVVRESLSNAARHAGASSVELRIEVHDDLVVTVTDDGRGLRDASRLSGLANMRTRAERHGGSMALLQPGERGTQIQWRVPLPT